MSTGNTGRQGLGGVFATLAGRRQRRRAAGGLYVALVEQARRPEIFLACGIPDTPEGRFEMVLLHAFVVMHRLKQDRPVAGLLAQDLFDLMFDDMDQNLREMGVGDLSVGKKVKRMARAFYGRIVAYEKAIDAQDDAILAAALTRNLYGGRPPDDRALALLTAYLRGQVATLAGQPIDGLTAGIVRFAEPSLVPEVPADEVT